MYNELQCTLKLSWSFLLKMKIVVELRLGCRCPGISTNFKGEHFSKVLVKIISLLIKNFLLIWKIFNSQNEEQTISLNFFTCF